MLRLREKRTLVITGLRIKTDTSYRLMVDFLQGKIETLFIGHCMAWAVLVVPIMSEKRNLWAERSA